MIKDLFTVWPGQEGQHSSWDAWRHLGHNAWRHIWDVVSRVRTAKLCLALSLLLTACEDSGDRGAIQLVEGFAGMTASSEPRAAVVGRDILGIGGTAVDAAVAMSFALTATQPSRAGIASQGACVVFASNSFNDELPLVSESYAFGRVPGSSPIPLMPRAMGVLHARHGVVPWALLLAPAERLAQLGHPISRAFAGDIRDAAGIIVRSDSLRRRFSNKAGALAREGDVIVQGELSGILSGIRRQGAGYLYSGGFAKRLVDDFDGLGVKLSLDELATALPMIAPALERPYGDDIIYMAHRSASGSLMTGQLIGILTDIEDYADADQAERAHLLGEAALRGFASQAERLATGSAGSDLKRVVEDEYLERIFADFNPGQHRKSASFSPAPPRVAPQPYSTGFVVGDRWGSAVACAFTMNGLFGSGRSLPTSGLLLDAEGSPESSMLAPVIVANAVNGDMRFAGVGLGGLAAPSALASVASLVLEKEVGLEQGMAEPRVAHVGNPDALWHEEALPGNVLENLAARGHRLAKAPMIAELVAFSCPGGVLDDSPSCIAVADKRWHGLALRAQ